LGTSSIGLSRSRSRFFISAESVRCHFSFRFTFLGHQEAIVLKTILFGLCAVVVATCVFNVDANAQSTGCTIPFYCGAYSIWNPICIPAKPAQAFNCVNLGPWSFMCDVLGNKCHPPCDGCHDQKALAGHPIDLATGNTFIEETDLKLPGLGGGLSLVRTWNSTLPSYQVGLFGPNWRSSYEERVFVDGLVGQIFMLKYARGDGDIWSFGWNGNYDTLASPANTTATLDQGMTHPNLWTLVLADGEQRLFDMTSGSLTFILDRNGNTTQLSYDATNRLITVSDPAQRHIYFHYPSDTSRLVSSITSDFGITLSYSYDAQGRLIQVTKPDQTTLNFTYDSNSNITAVKDTNGIVLESHTYDSSHRGLTSSRAGGVEAISVTYQ
jgi:YD repeat-containing protein